ncbi:MAG: putative glyoxalase superfamily protein PhnB [Paraglaciecola sp.]|jgi:uncharacterized glyoxalase superfamily protein PhnB
MTTIQNTLPSTVIPCLRYRDAPAAIRWLCATLGFEEHLVVPLDDGKIAHAQLVLGQGMIMLGSIKDSDYDQHLVQPDQINGKATQCNYLVINDIEALYQKVLQTGTEIVSKLAKQEHGGECFSCRDPEGHIWSLGDYDPWA